MALPQVSFVEMIPRASVMIAGLTRFAGSLRSTRGPMEEAVDSVIRPSIEEAFESEGPGWAPLAPVTIANRRREGFSSGPILTKTGNLRGVATSKGIWQFEGQRGNAFVPNLPGAEYGEDHEFGTENMPARPFMYIGDNQMEQIEDIFENFIAINAAKYVASGFRVGRLLR